MAELPSWLRPGQLIKSEPKPCPTHGLLMDRGQCSIPGCPGALTRPKPPILPQRAAALAYGIKPERIQGLRVRLYRYGLSIIQFLDMVKACDGKCQICGKDKGIDLCIDHCHDTKQVRGLLCTACNSGLGSLGDSVEGLERAIRYLKAQNIPRDCPTGIC